MRKLYLAGAVVLLVLVAWTALSRRQQVWLTVPEEFRGATVYADGLKVAAVEDPGLTLLDFWSPKGELRLEKPGYKPVRLTLAPGSKSYPLVTKADLVASPETSR